MTAPASRRSDPWHLSPPLGLDSPLIPLEEEQEPRGAHPMAHVLSATMAGCVIGALDGYLAAQGVSNESLSVMERRATLLLAIALHMPICMALGVLLGLCVWLLRRALPPPRRRRLLGSAWLRAGAVALLAGGAVRASRRLAGKQIDWHAVDPAVLCLPLLGLLVYLVYLRALRDMRRHLWVAGSVLLAVAYAVVCGIYQQMQEAHAASLLRIEMEAPLSARLQAYAMRLLDRDGDGYPRLLCSKGCDCDDRDPRISPEAVDVPDNGIDEDCSGEDLSLAEVERLASLFDADGLAAPEPAPAGWSKEGARLHVPAEEPPPSWPPPRFDPQRPPNILLITIDTVRADHLGVYGYPHGTSPRIDAFARDAVVFEQARAAGPATRFSIPAMLTGKHFTEVKRTSAKWPKVAEEEVLLAERLRDAGYFTAAFHSVIYFREHYGFGQGFAVNDLSFFKTTEDPWNAETAKYVTDQVLGFTEKRRFAKGRPFFIWAYYGDPHAPYIKHPGHPQVGARGSRAYDTEISYTDVHVGRLLDGLGQRGLLDETLVILMSDHGEGLDKAEDHGARFHSKNLHDEMIRVPLIVGGPGIMPGRVRTPVSLLDLVPTVLDLLGQRPGPELRGQSLLPYLRGESPPHRPIFAEKHRAEDAMQKAMVLWPYKVISVLPFNDFSIYNLDEDPRERNNLLTSLPDKERERLLGAYRYWATHVLRPIEGNPRH